MKKSVEKLPRSDLNDWKDKKSLKIPKDKQRSTKHTYKTTDLVTPTPLKSGGELRCSGRISRSCSTSDTRRALTY
jgi:hypothetical protein